MAGIADEPQIIFGADASEVADAAAEASSAVQDFGDTVSETTSSMGDMDSETSAATSSVADAFEGMANNVTATLASIKESLEGIEGVLRTVGTLGGLTVLADAAASTGEKLLSLVAGVDAVGSHMMNLAQATAIPVQALDSLRLAMERSGISAGSMESIVQRLSRTMQTATNAHSLQARSFAALGISQAELAQHSNDLIGLLELMADRYNSTSDGAAKLGLTMTLLRMGGADLVSFLDQGSFKIKQLMQDAVDSGAAMTEAQGEQMRLQDAQIKDLQARWDAWKRQTVIDVGPAIIDTLNNITTWLGRVYKGWQQIADILNKIAGLPTVGGTDAENEASKAALLKEQYDQSVQLVEHLKNTLAAINPESDLFLDVQQQINEQLKEQNDLMSQIAGTVKQVGGGPEVLGGPVYKAPVGKLQPPTTDKSSEQMAKWQADLLELEQKYDGFYNDVAATDIKFWSDVLAHGGLTTKELQAVNKALWDAEKVQRKQDLADYIQTQQQKITAATGDVAKQLAIQDETLAHLRQTDAARSAEFRQASAERINLARQEEQQLLALHESSMSTEFSIQQKGFGAEQTLIQTAFGQKRISQGQEIADLTDLYQQEYAAAVAYYTQKAALDVADVAKVQADHDAIRTSWAELQVKLINLQATADKTMGQGWQQLIDQMNSGIDSMVTGVLQGTQTMWQAFGRFTGDMLLTFGKSIAQMTLQWLAFKAKLVVQDPFSGAGMAASFGKMLGLGGGGGGQTQLAASIAQLNQALTGSTAAVQAGSAITQAGSEIAQLGTEASTGLTVVTQAATPPQISLMSAIIANTTAVAANTVALGQVALTNAISAVPMLESGGFILRPGLAMLHPGETVVPAKVTDAVFGGGGNAGNNVTFHVHAMDAQSVSQFFQRHGRTVARTVAGQFKDNPGIRPNF